jgi:hypothetical protein
VARRLLILGSTGSIGTQALDIVESADDIELVGLCAGRSWEALVEQARTHGVERIALADADAAARAAEAWTDGEVLSGPEGLMTLVIESEADLVLNALVGSVGLGPTVATLGEGIDPRAGQQGVSRGGRRARDPAAEATGAQVIPVDSEHSALHQLIAAERPGTIDKLVLTASGGPFRGRSPRRARGRERRRGPPAPHMGHGGQDHDRLGHADEQGPRAHRGPPPLRHALRPHRRGRASAVGRALLRPAVRRRRRSRTSATPTCASRSPMRCTTPSASTSRCVRSTWPRWAR